MFKLENGLTVKPQDLEIAETGQVFGIAMETYPVKWRAHEALRHLEEIDRVGMTIAQMDAVRYAQGLLCNILREVFVAELLRIPRLIPVSTGAKGETV